MKRDLQTSKDKETYKVYKDMKRDLQTSCREIKRNVQM